MFALSVCKTHTHTHTHTHTRTHTLAPPSPPLLQLLPHFSTPLQRMTVGKNCLGTQPPYPQFIYPSAHSNLASATNTQMKPLLSCHKPIPFGTVFGPFSILIPGTFDRMDGFLSSACSPLLGSVAGRHLLISPSVYGSLLSPEYLPWIIPFISMALKTSHLGEFPGSLVVRILGFHCHGPVSIPGWGTKIPQKNSMC